MKNLVMEIQNQLFDKLEEKNSWEKNEVKVLFQGITVEVLSDYASAMTQLKNTPIREPKQSLPENNEPVPPDTHYSPTVPFSGFDDDDEIPQGFQESEEAAYQRRMRKFEETNPTDDLPF